jgi:hypothetical protein
MHHRAQIEEIFAAESGERHRRLSHLSPANTPERNEEGKDNLISSLTRNQNATTRQQLKHNHLFRNQQTPSTSMPLMIIPGNWRWHGDDKAIQE